MNVLSLFDGMSCARIGFIEGKAQTLTANAWEQNNLVVERNGVRQLNQSKESAGQQPYQQNRIYDTEGKSPALMHDTQETL